VTAERSPELDQEVLIKSYDPVVMTLSEDILIYILIFQKENYIQNSAEDQKTMKQTSWTFETLWF